MQDISAQDFLDVYPEFQSCFKDPVIEHELEFAKCNINECVYTEKKGCNGCHDDGSSLSYLRREDNSLGQGGIVTSDKVGDLAQSYSVLTPDHGDAYWSQTQYGLKYLQLRKTLSVAARGFGLSGGFKLSVKTQDVDKGYKALLRELKILEKEPFVKVGLLKDKKTEDGGSLAVIVASNEFGTDDGRIPERSFLRSTADIQRKRINRIIEKGIDNIIKQKTTSKSVLTRVGMVMQRFIQQKIKDIRTPANAESTKKQKGSSNPLIDSGQMRQSMRYGVVMDGKKSKGST